MKYFQRRLWLISLMIAFLTVVTVEGALAFDITIITATSRTISFEANSETTVAEVKDFVYDITQLHAGNQKMFKDSVELENSRTLESYGISDGDTLHVKMGLSGMPHREKKSGAFLKIIILLVIIAGLIIAFRKKKPDKTC